MYLTTASVASVAAEHALVVARLPQRLAVIVSIGEATHLFEPFDECPQVSILRLREDQQVNVIGHEAVRENCKLEKGRRVLKLRERAGNHGF